MSSDNLSVHAGNQQAGSQARVHWSKQRKLWIILGVLLGVLLVARIALPFFVKNYINKTLNELPGYSGSVKDVDIALWRGAYRIEGIDIWKTEAKREEPFFAARAVDISVDWKALFQRRLVTKIFLSAPQLQFIQRKSEKESQTSIDESWQDKVQKLLPFEINQFAFEDGLIRYQDLTRKPAINIYLQDLSLNTTNISNAERADERLPSDLTIKGQLLKSGRVSVKAKANFLAEPIQTDLNVSLKNLNLRELNDFAKAYGNFDFEEGQFGLTMELAATKSRYDGYVKTLLEGVDVVEMQKELKQGDSLPRVLWEGLVGAISEIFQNQQRDRFAARIPITGTRENLEIKTWATIGSILRNAFVKAISPEYEDSVEYSEASRSAATSSGEEASTKKK